MDDKVFRKYLIRLQEHYAMILQVHSMSAQQRHEADKIRFGVDLLEDIIHHYDLLVKGEDNIDV